MQGPRSEFQLTGAKNWWLLNSGQTKEIFWSYKLHFHNKFLRMKDKVRKKSEKVPIKTEMAEI